MSICELPHDLYLNISSFLIKSDLYGFMMSCKKTRGLLLWAYDDAGVHLCLGCDLTYSMDSTYRNLKVYLLQTIKELKATKTIGRTLASSVFYWDLDRCSSDGGPYTRIQPPSESFVKQEMLITDAEIASGGGAECGGIALCELNTQFKNRWISQYNGTFGKSMDVLLLCLDAPFHFMVDNDSYYEVTRKHAINTDWISAIHQLCEKGVLIIMVIINTQQCFQQSLRLLGGFNNKLGGVSITINPNDLKDLPIFIKSIIDEESQKRKIVNQIFKKVAYKHKSLPKGEFMKIMQQKLSTIDDAVKCANIPREKLILSSDVKNADRLAECKTMEQAINAGLLESEAVMKRMLFNAHGRITVACQETLYNIQQPTYNSNILPSFNSGDDNDDDGLPPIMPPTLSLVRQQSVCAPPSYYHKRKISTTYLKPEIKDTELDIDDIPQLQINKQVTEPANFKPKPVSKQLTFDKLINPGFSGGVNTFGLHRHKSIAMPIGTPPAIPTHQRRSSVSTILPITEEKEESDNDNSNKYCVIEGSVKCYLKEPDINFGHRTSELLSLVERNGTDNEIKFRDLLKTDNPNQYELYMNGGLFNRFEPAPIHDLPQNPIQNNTGLIGATPSLNRSFSNSTNTNSNMRILRFIRSNSIQENTSTKHTN